LLRLTLIGHDRRETDLSKAIQTVSGKMIETPNNFVWSTDELPAKTKLNTITHFKGNCLNHN